MGREYLAEIDRVPKSDQGAQAVDCRTARSLRSSPRQRSCSKLFQGQILWRVGPAELSGRGGNAFMLPGEPGQPERYDVIFRV